MNITLNVTLPDVLVALIERALAGVPATAVEAPPAPKVTRAPKATAPAPTPPTAEEVPPPAAAPAPKAEPCAVDYEQVKTIAVKLGQVKGRQAIVDLLSRYGVTRAPELKPAVFAQFVAECEELLA